LAIQFTTCISFNGSNGANRHAGLTADANIDLFGTTATDGANGWGPGNRWTTARQACPKCHIVAEVARTEDYQAHAT
jgi:hypothetical protein